jgi:hypothetical protein
MGSDEFYSTLDRHVACSACAKVISGLEWSIAPVGIDWMGICICRCPVCSLLMVAAAGSSEVAHVQAQATRSKLMSAVA